MFSGNRGDGFQQGRPLPLYPTVSHIDDAPAAAVAAAAAAVAAATSVTSLIIIIRLVLRRIFLLLKFVGVDDRRISSPMWISIISAFNVLQPFTQRFFQLPTATFFSTGDRMPSSSRRPRLQRMSEHCSFSFSSLRPAVATQLRLRLVPHCPIYSESTNISLGRPSAILSRFWRYST